MTGSCSDCIWLASPWSLQDKMGEASSLPVPGLWEDILLDDRAARRFDLFVACYHEAQTVHASLFSIRVGPPGSLALLPK